MKFQKKKKKFFFTLLNAVFMTILFSEPPPTALDTAVKKVFYDLVKHMMYFQAILKNHITMSVMA